MTATSLDAAALVRWMDSCGIGPAGAPVSTSQISGGSQNAIFEVRRDDLRAALRIPPPHAPAARDDGILREWQIIAALDGSEVPHTRAIGVCADPTVLGRAFYLMEFVDGWSVMSSTGWPEPFRSDRDTRAGLATALVDGVAQLAAFDWRSAGLDTLGRPDGYHERQVDRWTRFLDRVRARPLPGFDEAAAWLRDRRPIDFAPGLMHGDYQFANVMFADSAPAELVAIVDWEMGTIGDPKLDLASVLHSWPEDTDGADIGYADITGMPGRTALIERFAEMSGRQVDDIDYYLVLAKWKLAIVLEQGFQRAGDDPKLQAFGDIALTQMTGAADLAESSDYRSPK